MFSLSSREVTGQRVLIVEDDDGTAEALQQTVLASGGTVIGQVPNIEAGLSLIQLQPADQVLLHTRYTDETLLIIPRAFAPFGATTVFLACHTDWFDLDDEDDGLWPKAGVVPRSPPAARRRGHRRVR